MATYKLICPACGKGFSSESKKSLPCLHCGAKVVYTGFTKDEFDQKSAAEKQQIIENVKSGHIVNKPENINDTNFWIALLNKWTNFFIVIGVLASIVGGIYFLSCEEVVLGVLVLVIGVFVTLISMASIKVFLSAAKDLKFIRNYFEGKL